MYSSAFVPINKNLRHTLPLFKHPDYAGGYSKLTYVKALIPGPKDNRLIGAYRVEGDRCTYPSILMSHSFWRTDQKISSVADPGPMGR